MSYDDWDEILDGMRRVGAEHGITVADRMHVPEGDAVQLFSEAAEAYTSAALAAFRARHDDLNGYTSRPGQEWWTTGERLAHERHHFADTAKNPHCRICAHEARGQREEAGQ